MSGGLEARFEVRRSDSFTLELELSIPSGRTVALLGPNGAGKSTTVGALAGLLTIDSGRIALKGRVLAETGTGVFVPPEERRVGVVFQDHLLFPHMSALENVAFGLRSRGASRAAGRESAREWIERMRLEGLGERKPSELSGGQAQRIAIARTLATEPELLLLDEPLSALDVTARSELRRFLAAHLEAFRGPRILITHDPGEAFQLADEIHVIEGGRVTQAGSAEDLRMRPMTTYAADVAGSNFFTGTASDGTVRIGDHALSIAERTLTGPVRISIRPSAVAVHREAPGGSPRNQWRTTIERVEEGTSRARVLTGLPLPLMVEVTLASREELSLAPGREIWVSLKATEIGVESAS